MIKSLILGVLLILGTCISIVAVAQFQSRRTLSEVDVRLVIEALVQDPTSSLSEDPSCRSDLSKPGSMSIAQGLGLAVTRAVTDKKSVTIRVDCFVRPGYPLGPKQESCRLAFLSDPAPNEIGYGLVFVMDWGQKKIVPGSVECY